MTAIQQAFAKAAGHHQAVLAKTLEEWGKDDTENAAVDKPNAPASDKPSQPAQPQPGRRYFQTTNNVSRVSFNYVRDNPGVVQKDACKALAAQGFNPNSVSSLIPAMIRQGLLRRDSDMRLYTKVSEYKPLKSSATMAKLEKERRERREQAAAKRKPAPTVEHIPSYAARHAQGASKARTTADTRVDELLESLSVLQAKALYERLKETFGAH